MCNLSSIGPVVSEEKMFENVDGRTDGRTTDGRTTDGRTTDARVTGILIAHLGAFGSGELKNNRSTEKEKQFPFWNITCAPSIYTVDHPKFTVSNQKRLLVKPITGLPLQFSIISNFLIFYCGLFKETIS